MAASVVDLPLPVVPVSSTNPRTSLAIRSITSTGRLSSSNPLIPKGRTSRGGGPTLKWISEARLFRATSSTSLRSILHLLAHRGKGVVLFDLTHDLLVHRGAFFEEGLSVL